MKKKICLIFYLVTISFLFAESLSGFMNIPFGIDKKEFKENLLKKNIAIELESNDWINCELNFKFLGHDGCSFCAYFENERFSSFVLEMLDYKDDASFSQIRKIATDIASTIGITSYESDLDGILLEGFDSNNNQIEIQDYSYIYDGYYMRVYSNISSTRMTLTEFEKIKQEDKILTDFDIFDFFPYEIGDYWIYNSSEGKIIQNNNIENKKIRKETGELLILYTTTYLGIGNTSTLVTVKDNTILVLATKNILGNYMENTPPFPVLVTEPNRNGNYIDKEDYVSYKSYKGNCEFDNQKYDNCIVFEESITNNNIVRTKKTYFAKGVGMVYCTIKNGAEPESVYLKLYESSLTK